MSDLELRRAVAVEVMGWELRKRCRRVFNPVMGGEVIGMEGREDCMQYITSAAPAYETSIESAWEVVERMRELEPGWRFGLVCYGGMQCKAEWFGHADPEQNYGQRHGEALAPTAPEAICRAALAAIREGNQ